MCASYGLDPRAGDFKHFARAGDEVMVESIQQWAEKNAREVVKPTGVNMRNLNPIIREHAHDGAVERRAELAWWKLWVGGAPAKFPAINARVESLMGSGAWSGPLKARRALVPVTEYFEKGRSFAFGGQSFALAGIYNVAKFEDNWMLSYAIITQPAAPHVAEIHDRMPLIVPADLYDDWLDPALVGDQGLLDAVVAHAKPLAESIGVSA